MGCAQRRIGPFNLGGYGIFSSIINGCNLIISQLLVPKLHFYFGFQCFPVLFFCLLLQNYIVVYPFFMVDIYLSLFILIWIMGLSIFFIILSAFSSCSKYSMLGCIRIISQLISFELIWTTIMLIFIWSWNELSISSYWCFIILFCYNLFCYYLFYYSFFLWYYYFIYYSCFCFDYLLFNSIPLFPFLSNSFFSFHSSLFFIILEDILSYNNLLHYNDVFDFIIFCLWLVCYWLLYNNYILFIILFICILGESNRVPYDLPEAESELVAGFITEYSSVVFSLILFTEYASIIAVSFWVIIIYSIYIDWFIFILFFVCLIRCSLNRFKFDELMTNAWIVILPVIFSLLLLSSIIY